jgi:hypothetical protein
MQNQENKFQVIKLFRNKPAELLSNNHSDKEAESICLNYLEDLRKQGKNLNEVEYLLVYQNECPHCREDHRQIIETNK